MALPTFDGSFSSVFTGITLALPIGKILGITLLAYVANKIASEDARLELQLPDFAAVAGLAGVGFTVSLLMANLAFFENTQILAEATLAVIIGSLMSMAFGAWLSQRRGRYYMKKHREGNAS
ncbi:MAG: Na+/H+ antiporter NhaA [Aquiluna sp.]